MRAAALAAALAGSALPPAGGFCGIGRGSAFRVRTPPREPPLRAPRPCFRSQGTAPASAGRTGASAAPSTPDCAAR